MKKFLVIEDCAATRNLFLECLKAEGFYTIGAENGLVGVQRAIDELPDLVICDIMMPDLDGYGVLTTLRTDPVTATIPFIFVTAKTTRADLRLGMELGADDYLTKPCTVDELLGAIATQLEKRAALRQWYTAQSQQVPALPSADTATFAAAPQSIFPSDSQLSEVFQFIEANYHQSIGLNEVAQAFGYSPSYLTGLLRLKTGQTVNHWIIKRRMAAAQALLMETNLSVNQIAEAVGYQNTGHFFRQFRQYHGSTPQTWRKAYRIQASSNKEQQKC